MIKKNPFVEISQFSKLKKRNISLVVICNPTSLHYKTFKKFSKICKNFLIEKPISNNLNELSLMQSLIKNKKINIFSGYMMRFDPRIIKIKKILKKQKIIFSEFTWNTFLPNWHKYEDFREGYAFNSKLGGGVIKTCSHEIDLSLFFNGKVKETLSLEFPKKLGRDVEESVTLNLKHVNGNYSKINLDFTNKIPRRDFKIFTNKFYIKWDFNNTYIEKKYYNKTKNKKISINYDLNNFYFDQNNFVLQNINRYKIRNFENLLNTEKTIHSSILSIKKNKIIKLN
tara:strand:+ start:62 stop:913 length:852 start_codon:yes stop_codon:yes gene_type:complete